MLAYSFCMICWWQGRSSLYYHYELESALQTVHADVHVPVHHRSEELTAALICFRRVTKTSRRLIVIYCLQRNTNSCLAVWLSGDAVLSGGLKWPKVWCTVHSELQMYSTTCSCTCTCTLWCTSSFCVLSLIYFFPLGALDRCHIFLQIFYKYVHNKHLFTNMNIYMYMYL